MLTASLSGLWVFAAHSPHRLPLLRFAGHLMMPKAKLGAKVDRYSFLMRLTPPLLPTGLTRFTNIRVTSIDLDMR
jgi:hypothetical protein